MSEIEWRRLRNITAREIVNALVRDGFVFYNQRGSHLRYRHSDGRRVTVTVHRAGIPFRSGRFVRESRFRQGGPKTTFGVFYPSGKMTNDDSFSGRARRYMQV